MTNSYALSTNFFFINPPLHFLYFVDCDKLFYICCNPCIFDNKRAKIFYESQWFIAFDGFFDFVPKLRPLLIKNIVCGFFLWFFTY